MDLVIIKISFYGLFPRKKFFRKPQTFGWRALGTMSNTGVAVVAVAILVASAHAAKCIVPADGTHDEVDLT